MFRLDQMMDRIDAKTVDTTGEPEPQHSEHRTRYPGPFPAESLDSLPRWLLARFVLRVLAARFR
jgi:hypothetical protein